VPLREPAIKLLNLLHSNELLVKKMPAQKWAYLMHTKTPFFPPPFGIATRTIAPYTLRCYF